MVTKLQRLLGEIQKLRGFNERSEHRENFRDLGEAIAQAQKEWNEAKTMLNYVNDPDLIDHVILTLEAAERKYMYLIKVAKNSGYRMSLNEKEREETFDTRDSKVR